MNEWMKKLLSYGKSCYRARPIDTVFFLNIAVLSTDSRASARLDALLGFVSQHVYLTNQRYYVDKLTWTMKTITKICSSAWVSVKGAPNTSLVSLWWPPAFMSCRVAFVFTFLWGGGVTSIFFSLTQKRVCRFCRNQSQPHAFSQLWSLCSCK